MQSNLSYALQQHRVRKLKTQFLLGAATTAVGMFALIFGSASGSDVYGISGATALILGFFWAVVARLRLWFAT